MRRAVLVPLVAVLVACQHPRCPAEDVLAVKGGTVLTITKGVIENGTVLIRDGKIAAVGADVDVPAGAAVIDATGEFVMPGIVDTHSHMGVYAWPAVGPNEDGNELSGPIMPEVRAADAVNAADPAFARARAGGVTTVQILPGSGNMVGGESVVVKLRPAETLDAMRFAGAPRGLKMASGENPKRVYGSRNQAPASRMGNFAVLREALVKAQEYRRKWDDYEEKRRAYEAKRAEADRAKAEGKPPAAGLVAPDPPERNLKYEALADVLRGAVRVHIHCYRQDELLTFLRIADEFGFRIAAFQHGLEAYKVADRLAAAGVGVATFSDWWGFKWEAWDAIPHNAGMLAKAGVRVAIHSDSPNIIQRLYHESAKAVKYGLDPDEGLKAITIHPAWMLGLDGRIGSLEPGKDADLAIFTRHPFDVYARIDKTIIDGRVVYDRAASGGLPVPPDLPPSPVARFLKSPAPPPGAVLSDSPLPPVPGSPAPAGRVSDADFVLRNARVFTMTGPPIARGTVVVRAGRVAAVGADVPVPDGARVIDAEGRWVLPGLIDARTRLGLVEVDAIDMTRDNDEASAPSTPHVRVVDAFNPGSALLPVARMHGVTAALVAPADGNVISGQGALMALDGATAAEMTIRAPAALHLNFGEAAKGRWHDRNQEPYSRMGIAALLRDQLVKAQEYARKLDAYGTKLKEYEAKKAEHEKAKAGEEPAKPVPPDRDLRLEALVPVVKGELPVIARAQRVDDILTAVRIAEEFRLRLVLSHAAEAHTVAALLAEKKIPVLVGPVTTQPDSLETQGAVYENAALLAKAGVTIAIQTDGDHNVRNLPYEAGLAVAYGLPWGEALKAVTVNPATILGVEGEVGSIAPGRRADLIVTDGDPFQPLTQVERVFIAGREVPLESRQTELYKRYRR